MKISETKKLTPEKFASLEEEKEPTNQPLRKENESFMEFVRKGSERVKKNPIVKNALRIEEGISPSSHLIG